MPKPTREPRVQPGPRFVRAVELACDLHRTHSRNDYGVPYVSHLLAVAALVLEHGGEEDEAVAALLHDAAEDCGGRATLEKIRHAFGAHVAAIVEGCSDTLETPKPDWRPRKEAYVARLATESPSVRRVAAADKIHNMLALLADLRETGAQAFDRFKPRTAPDQVWFYRTCAETLVRAEDCALTRRVADEARRLEQEVVAAGLLPQRREP